MRNITILFEPGHPNFRIDNIRFNEDLTFLEFHCEYKHPAPYKQILDLNFNKLNKWGKDSIQFEMKNIINDTDPFLDFYLYDENITKHCIYLLTFNPVTSLEQRINEFSEIFQFLQNISCFISSMLLCNLNKVFLAIKHFKPLFFDAFNDYSINFKDVENLLLIDEITYSSDNRFDGLQIIDKLADFTIQQRSSILSEIKDLIEKRSSILGKIKDLIEKIGTANYSSNQSLNSNAQLSINPQGTFSNINSNVNQNGKEEINNDENNNSFSYGR